jgi:hypothetical protein
MGNYKVESDFMHNGLRCVVVFTSMGHRCGYVGIDKEHPLFEKDYSCGCAMLDDISVHGGITFSDGGYKSNYPIESDLWWFGFDCAHWQDSQDKVQSFKYGLITEEQLTRSTEEQLTRSKEFRFLNEGTHRDQEYVESECKLLAEQIAKLTEDDGQCSD